MSRRKNTSRSDAALFALQSHACAKGERFDEEDTSIIDLLADLRHYCDRRGLCFGDLDRISYDHYLIEIGGSA